MSDTMVELRKYGTFGTMRDVRALNRQIGHHWFDPSTLAFFESRIETPIMGGTVFVSSEKGPSGARAYSVRIAWANGDISTHGDFMGHSTKYAAARAAREYLAQIGR